MVHSFNASTEGAEAGTSQFQTSLVYKAEATQGNLVLKNKNKTKQKPTIMFVILLQYFFSVFYLLEQAWWCTPSNPRVWEAESGGAF